MNRREALFQFLIGRLETYEYPIKILLEEPFQFLIGRLETYSRARDTTPNLIVSIPHR